MLGSVERINARIQEIQARISSFQATPPSKPHTGADTLSSVLPNGVKSPSVNVNLPFSPPRPFDLTLAQAQGRVQLRKMDETLTSVPANIEALVHKYASQNGLQPELVRAVIQQESGGNPRSESVVGAMGLMQLMPETAKGLGVQNAFDPEQNIAGGTRYLAGLMKEFGNDLPRALAAYNAGPNAVRKAGGVPNFPETQNYVRKIMSMVENARIR